MKCARSLVAACPESSGLIVSMSRKTPIRKVVRGAGAGVAGIIPNTRSAARQRTAKRSMRGAFAAEERLTLRGGFGCRAAAAAAAARRRAGGDRGGCLDRVDFVVRRPPALAFAPARAFLRQRRCGERFARGQLRLHGGEGFGER